MFQWVSMNQDMWHHRMSMSFVYKNVYERSTETKENTDLVIFINLTNPVPQVAEQGLCWLHVDHCPFTIKFTRIYLSTLQQTREEYLDKECLYCMQLFVLLNPHRVVLRMFDFCRLVFVSVCRHRMTQCRPYNHHKVPMHHPQDNWSMKYTTPFHNSNRRKEDQ